MDKQYSPCAMNDDRRDHYLDDTSEYEFPTSGRQNLDSKSHKQEQLRGKQKAGFIKIWGDIFRYAPLCANAAVRELANREDLLEANPDDFVLNKNVRLLKPDTIVVEIPETQSSRVKQKGEITSGWTFGQPFIEEEGAATALRMVLTRDGNILGCEVENIDMPDEGESKNEYRLRAPLRVAAFFPAKEQELTTAKMTRDRVMRKKSFARSSYTEGLITPRKIEEAATRGHAIGNPDASIVMQELRSFMRDHGLKDESSQA